MIMNRVRQKFEPTIDSICSFGFILVPKLLGNNDHYTRYVTLAISNELVFRPCQKELSM